MPKAQDRHNAPRIEMCEVLVDAMREALKAENVEDEKKVDKWTRNTVSLMRQS